MPKVRIEINAPSVRKIPVAIPILQAGKGEVKGTAATVAETLRSDLDATGLFDVLPPASFLEDPQRARVWPEAEAFSSWFTVGAELLVKGQVDQVWNEKEGRWEHVALLRAYDVYRRAELVGRKLSGLPSEARTMGHMFANLLLKELTGVSGPFGTWIAYVVQQGKGKELAIVEPDGGAARKITKSGSLSINPAWSRDGRYLYFTSYLQGKPDLYMLDLTTWKTWVVSRTPGINLSGRDSPDGKELLLSLSKDGNSEIYLMEKATRAMTRLTDNRAIEVAPSWSPDGKYIAFVSDRTGNPHVYTMDREGKQVKRLTFSGTHNGDPEWSPNGDLIAFTGRDERGVFQVYAVDPTGKDIRQITYGAEDSLDPCWSPDGRFLAVCSKHGGKNGIYLVRLGSREAPRRISPAGEDASQPAWSPRAFGS